MRLGSNQPYELVECRDFASRENVRPVGRGRHFPAQPESLDEVVDVRQMIEDVSGPEHDKTPPRHAPEELEQAAIAGAVDARRTRNCHGQPGTGGRLSRHALPFDFRLLVNVARLKGCVFGGRGMLDIAMHADRTAVHDAAGARFGRRLDDIADRRGVHRAIRRRWKPCLPIDGGDVIDDLDSSDSPRERGTVLERADRRFDACRFELSRLCALTHQPANVIPAPGQCPRKMATCKPGRAGD